MRILLVHNFYGSEAPSGENRVFESERRLLAERGNDVFEYVRHSDQIRAQGALGVVKGALSVPWNPWSISEIRRCIAGYRPDVVHVHNTFPLISPGVFHAVKEVPKVLTLHNFRIFCPAGIPMRDGRVCTECIDRRSSWPSLMHGCYRDSRIATLPLAFSVALRRHVHTWDSHVDAFISLTEFQRNLMVTGGLPRRLIHVKPNFYAGNPRCVEWEARRHSVVFVGRLTAEKGVENLVRAWIKWGPESPELRLVGDGELRMRLESLAKQHPCVPIRFLGQVTPDVAQNEIANARLLVLPSECYEGFPMVIAEAFAHGTPVAVSSLGPLASIVSVGVNGGVFEPGSPDSLARVVGALWAEDGHLKALGLGARRSFEELYSEGRNYRMLMDVYASAIDVSIERRRIRE